MKRWYFRLCHRVIWGKVFLEKGINTERQRASGETSFKNTVKHVYVCVCVGGEIRGAGGLWLRVLDAKCDGRLEDIFSTGVTFDYFRLHGDHLKNAVNQKRCVYETKEPTT